MTTGGKVFCLKEIKEGIDLAVDYKDKTGEIKICMLDSSSDDIKYGCSVSLGEDSSYIGTISSEMTRSGVGIYKYGDSEFYFGEFKNNIKNGKGFYIYKYDSEEKEIFFGNWENGVRKGKGAFYKTNQKDKDYKGDTVIVAEFEDNNPVFGIKATYADDDNYNIFFGDLTKDNVDKAVYIENGTYLYIGSFEEKKLKEGKVIQFNDAFNNKSIIKALNYTTKEEERGLTPSEQKECEEITKDYEQFSSNFTFSEWINEFTSFEKAFEDHEEMDYYRGKKFEEIIEPFRMLFERLDKFEFNYFSINKA